MYVFSLPLLFLFEFLSISSSLSTLFCPFLLMYQLTLFFPKEQHHYVSSGYTYKPLESFQEIDNLKRELAKQKQITLVVIPCWWDGKDERYVLNDS